MLTCTWYAATSCSHTSTQVFDAFCRALPPGTAPDITQLRELFSSTSGAVEAFTSGAAPPPALMAEISRAFASATGTVPTCMDMDAATSGLIQAAAMAARGGVVPPPTKAVQASPAPKVEPKVKVSLDYSRFDNIGESTDSEEGEHDDPDGEDDEPPRHLEPDESFSPDGNVDID